MQAVLIVLFPLDPLHNRKAGRKYACNWSITCLEATMRLYRTCLPYRLGRLAIRFGHRRQLASSLTRRLPHRRRCSFTRISRYAKLLFKPRQRSRYKRKIALQRLRHAISCTKIAGLTPFAQTRSLCVIRYCSFRLIAIYIPLKLQCNVHSHVILLQIHSVFYSSLRLVS